MDDFLIFLLYVIGLGLVFAIAGAIEEWINRDRS